MNSKQSEIIIKNVKVFDFKNNIKGDKRDILISAGKIVDKLKDEASAVKIEGKDHIAFPGAIDLKCNYLKSTRVCFSYAYGDEKCNCDAKL